MESDIMDQMSSRSRLFTRPWHLCSVMAWHMWYDYFSIPQPDAPGAESDQHTDRASDLGRAVASLPRYVCACEYFFVLAPTVAHEDGRTVEPCKVQRFALLFDRSSCLRYVAQLF